MSAAQQAISEDGRLVARGLKYILDNYMFLANEENGVREIAFLDGQKKHVSDENRRKAGNLVSVSISGLFRAIGRAPQPVVMRKWGRGAFDAGEMETALRIISTISTNTNKYSVREAAKPLPPIRVINDLRDFMNRLEPQPKPSNSL